MKYTRHTRYYLCPILLILSSFSITLRAQNTIPTTGGNATGSGGSVSYTIGQILYSTLSGTNGSVVQGVQQPFEISIVTTIRNTEGINLECLVYPNPTNGITKLIFKSPDYENMNFRLYDINGVLLLDKKVESMETEISLENLSSSIYFLKVIKSNIEIKLFKIVKR
jgi:Secretion system C-terminal sorting domain